MSVLIVFGFFAFGSSGIIASAESVNHYEYSYDYLKWYLKNYGTYGKTDALEGYDISNTSVSNGFRHRFAITYYATTNSISFSYLCRIPDQDLSFIYVDLTLPVNDTNRFPIYEFYSESVRGNGYVYPLSYNAEDDLKLSMTDNSGRTVSDSSISKIMNEAFEWGTREWNKLLVEHTGMTLGNFKFTNLYAENTSIYPTDNIKYTVTFDTRGHGTAPESQLVSKGGYVTDPGSLSAEGYRFDGWYKDENRYIKWNFGTDTVTSDMTLYAGWVKLNTPVSGITINLKQSATVEYRAKVTLKATATGITDGGYKLAVYEGNALKQTGDNMMVSYNVGEMTSGRTFTVKVIDSSGNALKDANGAEISKTIEIKVKNSFFDILIAFFKGLFGLLPSVEI